MKFLARMLTVCAIIALGGCALFSGSQTTLDATKKTLTLYTSFVQPAIITYGSLPDCSPSNPMLKLCKDHEAWLKIQAAAKAAHSSIQAAAPVINGEVPDIGQLQQAITDIDGASNAFGSKPPLAAAIIPSTPPPVSAPAP